MLTKQQNTNIGERLKNIREQLKLTQEEFAKILGISRSRLSQIEHNKHDPSVKILTPLAKQNLNINWLLTGEGEPFLTPPTKTGEKEPQELVKIPFLDAVAGAGTTGGVLSDEIVENVYFPSTIIRHLASYRPQDIFLIIISGDSMSPTIEAGDICIAQKYKPGEQLKSGAIYIVRNQHELLVKRVDLYRDKIILRSDNKKISDDILTKEDFEQLEIIAHVLAIIRII